MSTHDARALLETHARRIDALVADGVDPMDLRIVSGRSAGSLPVTVDLDPDPLPDGGGRLELAGSVLPAWGDEGPEVQSGVELRLVEGRRVVDRRAVPEGSGLFRVFEAHARDVIERIAEDHHALRL